MRDSFVFYRSFYDAIKDLPRDVQGEIYTAIMEYSLYGKETENLKPIAHSVFTLMKPQIDVNNKRFENGKKGGRPKSGNEPDGNQEETKEKPSNNQSETKSKPNVNDNVNVKTYTCAFESLWTAYPRKKEKAKAYKCYKARLADGFSEDELETAVKRYADECKINHTEEKYIKLGATFLGPNTPFTDYLGDWKPPEKEVKANETEDTCSVRLW